MFSVISLETHDTIIPFVATGKEASEIAQRLTKETGKTHQPRPLKIQIDWRAREKARFEDGTYIQIPWAKYIWAKRYPDHFVHISKNDNGKLAFTENEIKGIADIQTRMRPGRYLRTFYKDVLDPTIIDNVTKEFAFLFETFDLDFAKTEEEIEFVYIHGPNSCMSHLKHKFASPKHPSRIYAAGDLVVAYLRNKDKRITARALCWPEKKIFGRIYGDNIRLEAALTREGFKKGDFRGARLQRIEGEGKYQNTFVAPYLDGYNSVKITDDYLIIDQEGYVNCTGVEGYSSKVYYCNKCRNPSYPNKTFFVRNLEEEWCKDCIKNYTFYCDNSNHFYSDHENKVIMSNETVWHSSCFKKDGFVCQATKKNYHKKYKVILQDGRIWSHWYFVEHGYHCPECNQNFEKENKCSCEEIVAKRNYPLGSNVYVRMIGKATVVKQGSETYIVKKGNRKYSIVKKDIICQVHDNKTRFKIGEWVYVNGESYKSFLAANLPIEPAHVQIQETDFSGELMSYRVRTPREGLFWIFNRDILGNDPPNVA